MERKETIDACKALFAGQKDVRNVIAVLRTAKFTKIDSIKAIIEICGLSLAEAKEAVHLSPTWSDVREKDDGFHDDLISKIKNSELP